MADKNEEYTPEQAESLKRAAAKISGTPLEKMTIEQAESVLFEEIGYTPTSAELREIREQEAEAAKRYNKATAESDTQTAYKYQPEHAKNIEGLQMKYKPKQLELARQAAAMQDVREKQLAELTPAQIEEMKTNPEAKNAFKEKIHNELKELPEYNPELDPDSPQFNRGEFDTASDIVSIADISANWKEPLLIDAEKIKEAALGGVEDLKNAMISDSTKQIQTVTRNEIIENVTAALTTIKTVMQSDAYIKLKESYQTLIKWTLDHSEEIEGMTELCTYYSDLFPFIEKELDTLKEKHPEYEDLTLDDFLEDVDEDGKPKKSIWTEILERAQQEKATVEEAGKIIDELPLLENLLPTRHIMPNNALMNALQKKQPINAGAFDLVVSNPKGKRKEITTYISVTYDEESAGAVLTAANLSEYERQVSDAVVTLWLEAQNNHLPPAFTVDKIFREMPGGGDKPSPQQRGAITKAMEKMRNLHITVDATEELRQRGAIANNEKFELDDFYISAARGRRYRVKNGGQEVTAYKLHAEPLILTYSRKTNQILEVNSKYIEVHHVRNGHIAEIMPMNQGRQAMTGYMLRRIVVMKRDKKNKSHIQSNVILFETLFSEAGTATSNRDRTMDNRNFCFEVLDYWIITGLIKNYKKQTKGRKITGIEIEL